eukprot:3567064-Pyramimonas_sp.AAC.1
METAETDAITDREQSDDVTTHEQSETDKDQGFDWDQAGDAVESPGASRTRPSSGKILKASGEISEGSKAGFDTPVQEILRSDTQKTTLHSSASCGPKSLCRNPRGPQCYSYSISYMYVCVGCHVETHLRGCGHLRGDQ